MRVQTRKKIEILVIAVGLFVAVYLLIKYILPLVWPFIVAYGLARLIFPVTRFLRDKLHFHKNAAAAVTLIVSIVVIVAGLYIIGQNIVAQAIRLLRQWPVYEENILGYAKDVCFAIEGALGLEHGVLYELIYDGVGDFLADKQQRLLPAVMTNSLGTFRLVMDLVIVLALTVMAVFYMLGDMDNIRKTDKAGIFYQEIIYIKGLISKILKAYVRTQAIIIGAIAIVCSVGLAIIGNEYYIILGILIGLSDALPLIGVGTILIPWSVVLVCMGNYIHAVVLLVVFIACYLIREFLEPRLMGQEIGLSPISTLISIYVGYRLFGIFGMIVGPLVAVMLREILGLVKSRGH